MVTASFGVTEVQPGDSPASMLRRADRALLEAKRLGRNRVVQLGDGLGDFCAAHGEALPVANGGDGDLFVDRVLVTAVPLRLTFEKLRGFVLDHNAQTVAIKNDRVELHVNAEAVRSGRRRSDRPIAFAVELHLSEERVPTATTDGRAPGRIARTRLRVCIRLQKARDRRHSDAQARANLILASLKSYLMACDETVASDPASPQRAASMTSQWLGDDAPNGTLRQAAERRRPRSALPRQLKQNGGPADALYSVPEDCQRSANRVC